MKNAKRFIAIALLLAILASQSITVARADESPSWDDHTSTFTAGALKAVFEGNQPNIKFSLTTDTGNTEYDVRFKRLIEFNDTLGTGVFRHLNDTVIQTAELDVANWNPTYYPIKQGSSIIGIGVNFTNNIQITSGGSGTVPVTLIAKAYNTTQTQTINGQTITIQQAEIKVDVIITNWPFQHEATPRLALQINLHSERDSFETEQSDSTHTTSVNSTTNTNEQEFNDTNSEEQEIRFAGTLGTTGMIGFFRFVNTATINGTTTVPVLASYRGSQESEEGGMENEFAVFLSYPKFTGTLEHDPSFGFSSGGIPLLWYVLGGAVLVSAGVVVLLRRTRPRIQLASL
jgi:hypothetical protein